MTTFAIDIAIIAIIAFCGWRGYKNGLIRGIFGVVALIVSIFVANVAAKAYSEEFTDMLKPFAGGIIESALTEMDESHIRYNPGNNKHENNTEEFRTAYTALRQIHLPEPSAVRIAESAADIKDPEVDLSIRGVLSDVIAGELSSVFAYVAVFAIAFILVAIVFAVIGNLIGFVFSLPGLKLVDTIAGTALGIIKGFIIVFTLATVLRYFGILAVDTLEGTSILNGIVNGNPIANMLGL